MKFFFTSECFSDNFYHKEERELKKNIKRNNRRNLTHFFFE